MQYFEQLTAAVNSSGFINDDAGNLILSFLPNCSLTKPNDFFGSKGERMRDVCVNLWHC